MTTSRTVLLRKVPLFANLDEAQLTAIAQLVQSKRYRGRDLVVQQGDPGGDVFVIVSGHVKVVSSDAGGNDTALNILGPGEVFGEISLLLGEPRSASVAALEPCELLMLRRDAFLPYLKSSPEVAIELLNVVARRLVRLTSRAEDIAFLDVSGRLAKRIVQLADEFGERESNGSLRVVFRLSQQEIGELIGATRESANKHIRAWQDQGLLSQESGHLVIHDLQGLRALSRMADS